MLGVTRELFDRVGGFEESFTRYGGEDWELANRCWIAGADLVHLPGAVAWHDGPDFAGRDWEHERVKHLESVAVAALITEPGARGRGLVWAQPDIVIRLHDHAWEAADAVACAQSLLRDTDAGVWLASGRPLVEDPRVHAASRQRRCWGGAATRSTSANWCTSEPARCCSGASRTGARR